MSVGMKMMIRRRRRRRRATRKTKNTREILIVKPTSAKSGTR
jgi:hypothetical protein